MWTDPGTKKNRSQTYKCGNWNWGRAIPRKEIHKWYFHCSAGAWLGIWNCIVYNYLHVQYNTCTHVFDKVSESDYWLFLSTFFGIALPFSLNCVGRCWYWTQDCCIATFTFAVRRFNQYHSARSHSSIIIQIIDVCWHRNYIHIIRIFVQTICAPQLLLKLVLVSSNQTVV